MNKHSKSKSGSEFEALIATIQKCVHNRAKIETNKRIKDIDTGKLRQIDISLILADGPTEFFAMVEVRDRSRPVDAPYIGEISDKRRSVRSDAAFIVSRSGFTKPALIKAKKLGIRALTYDEATNADWSNWLQCKTMIMHYRKYDNVKIIFAEYGSNKIIDVSPEVIRAIQDDKNAKVLRDKDRIPFFSLQDLVKCFVNKFGDRLFENIPPDSSHQRRNIVINEDRYEPTLYIIASDDKLHKIGKMRIDLDCYIEEIQYPFKLMKYRKADAKKSDAEVATVDVELDDNKYRFEFIVPGAGESILAGTTVSLRTTKLD